MILLGILALILGFVFSIPIVWEIGVVLVVVGLILELLGAVGRPVAGRRHYY